MKQMDMCWLCNMPLNAENTHTRRVAGEIRSICSRCEKEYEPGGIWFDPKANKSEHSRRRFNKLVQYLEDCIKLEFKELHDWLAKAKIKLWKFYTWCGTLAILIVIQQFDIPRHVDWMIGFIEFMAIIMAIGTLIDVFVKERRLTDDKDVPVTGTDPEDADGKDNPA